MQRRRIIYAPDARYDRAKLAQWLTRNASSTVARRFDRRIQDAVKKLEYGSERGTVRDETIGLRVIGILPTVSIAFSVGEDTVTVHRVLYNGQNWMPGD
jgi:toxin ParE1/3/4